MQLHTLTSKHPRIYKRTRVGRGGKRGTTSGKGTKGQKSRSGRRIRPAVRDLIQRLPKLRGYSNKAQADKAIVITLDQLAKLGSEVSMQTLRDARVIRSAQTKVKILSNGEISKPITVTGLSLSAAARKKIEAAGGKVN